MTKGLDDSTFKAVLANEMRRAVGFIGGSLNIERADATRAYQGEPDSGNLMVIDGRSKAMSLDFRDTVEWLLPDLLRIFTGGEHYAVFDPVHKEDVEAAEQETEVVNQVIMKDNPGFHVFYTWFKDALMYKNGFVKWYWDDYPEQVTETYRGLGEMELKKLQAEEGVVFIGKPKSYPDPDFQGMADIAKTQGRDLGAEMAAQGVPIPNVYDVKVRRPVTGPSVCIEPIPPEEFLISAKAKTIKDTPFCAHRVRKTATELLMMGIPQSVIDGLASYDQEIWNPERQARYTAAENFAQSQNPSLDPAMKEVWVTEAWIRADRDGDGYAELIHTKFAGMDAAEILEEEEVDYIPVASLCALPLQHKVFGLSVYDLTKEIQEIKSTLWRAALDNLYFAVNGRWEVPDGSVGDFTYQDLLSPRPGSFVRVKQAGITPLATPMTGDLPFQALEYAETVKEKRTGVNEYNQGMDSDTLNKTATGVSMITRAGNARKELISRIFAETGVKDLAMGIHRELRNHAGEYRRRAIQLRGKWVDIDPSVWQARNHMTVNVGLGTENKDSMLAHLNGLGQWLSQIIQAQGGFKGPLVTGKQIYNFIEDFVKNAGLPKFPNRYAQDPDDPEVKQAMAEEQKQQGSPPVPPEIQVKLQQMQMDAQSAARDDATKRYGMDLEHQRSVAELKLKYGNAAADRSLEAEKLTAEVHANAADRHLEAVKAGAAHGLDKAALHLDAIQSGAQHGLDQKAHHEGMAHSQAEMAQAAELAQQKNDQASLGEQ